MKGLKNTAIHGDMRLQVGEGAAARKQEPYAAAPRGMEEGQQPQPRTAARWPWIGSLARAHLFVPVEARVGRQAVTEAGRRIVGGLGKGSC